MNLSIVDRENQPVATVDNRSDVTIEFTPANGQVLYRTVEAYDARRLFRWLDDQGCYPKIVRLCSVCKNGSADYRDLCFNCYRDLGN